MTLFHEAVGHQNYLSCLAFSPNGEQILSGSRDGTAKLWDVANGDRLRTFRWDAEKIVAVAWSPDGSLLAIAGTPPLQVFSQTEAERMFAFRRGERSDPEYCDDPTGERLSQLRVYRAADGKLMQTFDDAGYGVAFAPDGRSLAATNWEHLLIIDLITGARRVSPLHFNLTELFYSRNGTAVCCFGNYGVYVFDAVTAELVRIAHDPHLFSKPEESEDTRLWKTLHNLPTEVSGQDLLNHHLRFWRELLPEFSPQSFFDHCRDHQIAFTPDNRWTAFKPCLQQQADWNDYDWRNPIRMVLVDFESNERTRLLRDPDLSILTTTAFSSDGGHLAWGGSTQTVDLMRLQNSEECWSFDICPPAMTALCLSPNGANAVIGADDGRIIVCNWDKMDVSTILSTFDQRVEHLEFSPDGSWLLAASQAGLVKLIDVSSLEIVVEFETHRAKFLGGSFTPDGAQFISLGYAEIPMGSYTGRPAEMIRWSLPDGRARESLVLPDGLRVNSVSAAPHRRQLAFTSRAGVYLADITTNLSYQSLLEQDETGRVTFLPDSTRLLVAGEGCRMQFFDLHSRNVGKRFLAIKDGPKAFAFNSTASRLIRASSYDSELELFDAATGRYLRQFLGHVNAVNRVVFTPDDRRVLSVGRDGTLKIWEAETGELLASIVVFAEPDSAGRQWECLKSH